MTKIYHSSSLPINNKNIVVKADINTITLKNSKIAVTIDLSKSGRIMYLGNSKNLLNINNITRESSSWINHGGDYLWIGPQEKWNNGWPPPKEIDGFSWRIIKRTLNEVVIESPPFNGIVLQREFLLSKDKVLVTNRIINNSSQKQEWGLWSVTQIPMNSKIIFATPPNKHFKIFNYPPDVQLKELYKKNILIDSNGNSVLDIKEKSFPRFKIGVVAPEGKILIKTPNGSFTKSFSVEKSDVKYPHECNIEVYTEGQYIEIETLSKKVVLEPGKVFSYDVNYGVSPK